MKHLNNIFRLLILSLALCLLLGLSALAAEEETPDSPTVYGFGDIAGHEYEDDIRLIYEMGYAVGYTDGSFRPGRAFTRLEAAQLTAGLLGLSVDESYENPFHDTADIAGSEAVSAAVSSGYMSGRSADSFDPYGSVLKAEYMSLLARIAEFLGTEDLVSRLDEADALWAEDFSILTAAEAMHATCAMLEALDLPEPEAEEPSAEMPSAEMPSEEMPEEAELPEDTEGTAGLKEGESVTLNITLTAPAGDIESDEAAESEESPETGESTDSEESDETAVTEEAADAEESVEAEEAEEWEPTETLDVPLASGEASAEPSAEMKPAEAEESPAEEAEETETGEDPAAPQGVLAPAAAVPQTPAATEAPAAVQPSAMAQPQQIPVQNEIPANPVSTALPEIDPDDPGAEMKSSIYSFYASIRDKLVSFFVDLLG